MYDNEQLFGNDTLNNVPTKEHRNKAPGTIRYTTTDTEALIQIPRININASGVKKDTKMGLGEKSLFG